MDTAGDAVDVRLQRSARLSDQLLCLVPSVSAHGGYGGAIGAAGSRGQRREGRMRDILHIRSG